MASGKCYIDFRIVFYYASFTKKIGRHMLTPKNGRSGLTRLDRPIPWLDRPIPRFDRPSQSPQKLIWASPLDRSRRVDQDPYIEHPIRSPDERYMASGRSPRHRGG
jgi:hypothetical protein